MAASCTVLTEQVKNIARVLGVNVHTLASVIGTTTQKLGKTQVSLKELIEHNANSAVVQKVADRIALQGRHFVKTLGITTKEVTQGEKGRLFRALKQYNQTYGTNYTLTFTPIDNSIKDLMRIGQTSKIEGVNLNFRVYLREPKRDFDFYKGGSAKENNTKDYVESAKLLKEQEDNEQFQLSNSNISKINKELNKRIVLWLSRLGITYQAVDTITDKNGEPISAVAKADMLHKIIQVVENKADVTTLSEEAAHFLVEMLYGNPLLDRLIAATKGSVTHQRVQQEYADVYKDDPNAEEKILKEAVGKLIAQEIVNLWNETSEKHTPESKSLSLRVKRLFQNLLNFLKSRLQQSGLTSDIVFKETSPFREAAEKILGGQIDNLTLREDSNTGFYQLTPEDIAEKVRIEQALDAQRVYRDKSSPSGYKRVSDNSDVPFRVSDLIKKFYLKVFRNPNKELTAIQKMQARKGTIMHLYEEHIMRAFSESRVPIHLVIENMVYTELSDNPEFAAMKPPFFKLTSEQFDELVAGIELIFNQIQRNQDKINQQNGTNEQAKFYFELPITHKDFAGTVDLLVLYSNGAVAIYDYKNMSFKEFRGEVVSDVPEYKRTAFDSQITQYKNILFEGYGVKNFAETRIIPINVQYNFAGYNKIIGEYTSNSFAKVETKGENDDREYLDQIPVAKEFTDNEKLNKVLDNLYKRLDNLKQVLKGDFKNSSAKARLERTEKMIQNILVRQDFSYAFAEIENLIKTFYDNEQRLDSDPASLSAVFIAEIKEGIKVFLELTAGIKDVIDATGDTELISTRLRIQGQLIDLKQAVESKSQDVMRKSEPENIDITAPGKTYKGLGLFFRTLSEIDHPAFKKLSSWVRTAEDKTRQGVNEVIKNIQEKDKALAEWAEQNGMSKTDAFLKLYNKKTGKLYSKYSSVFWKDLEKARSEQNISFFLKYYKIQNDKGVLRYNAEMQEKFEASLERKKAQLERDYSGDNNAQFRQVQLEKWKKEHDISLTKEALFNPNNYFLQRDYTKLSEYLSDEQKYIEQHPALKAYYDFYIDMNQKFSDITGRRIDPSFVANIRQDMIDNIAMNGIGSVGRLSKSVLNSLELRDANAIYTEEELASDNVDLDGRPIMHVPLFFMDDLRTPLSAAQRRTIMDKVGKQFHPSNPEYGVALQYEYAKQERENGLQDKSYDLSRTLVLLSQTVYNYKHMTEIEGLAKLLLSEAKNRNVRSTIEQTDKTVIDRFKGKIASAVGIPADQVSALESFIDLYIYGKKSQSKMKSFTVGRKVDEYGNVIKSGKVIAPQLAIEQAMRYTSAVTLGLKPILAVRNYVQVKSNLYIMATEGLYFGMEEDKKSHKEAMTNPAKYYAAMLFFETQGNNRIQEKANKLSAKALSKLLTMDNLFIGLKVSDEHVDRKVLVNMMMAYGINSAGKIIRLNKITEGDTRSLYDRMTLEENGDVSIEGLSREQYIRFRAMAQQVSTKIKGTVPHEDRMLINTSIIGQLIMQYRSWMPGTIKARFNGMSYNPILDQVDVGRYIVGFQELTAHGTNTAKALLQMIGSSIPIIGFYFKQNMTVNEKASRELYNKFIKQNPDSQLTFDEFVNMRIGKMKSLALELQIIVALFMLQILAKGLIPDDKEKNPVEAFLTQTLFRSLNGAYLEASFFLNPYSATQIARSPLAITGFVINVMKLFGNAYDETRDTIVGKDMKGLILWEPDKRDKTPPGYFTSKMFPGVYAFTDFFDLYDTFSTYGGAR